MQRLCDPACRRRTLVVGRAGSQSRLGLNTAEVHDLDRPRQCGASGASSIRHLPRFQLSNVQPDAAVRCRDSGAAPWKPLARRASDEFFQGVECVRFDRAGSKAFVSVGFQTNNTVELEFVGVGSAKFDSAARYYDGRKAAYTLSLDNWGCNPWRTLGRPGRGRRTTSPTNYQAALHICRSFHLPLRSRLTAAAPAADDTWRNMQDELDRRDFSWEPAVTGKRTPRTRSVSDPGLSGRDPRCRADILQRLHNIPYGQHVFEHILTHGYVDETLLSTDRGRISLPPGLQLGRQPVEHGLRTLETRTTDFYGVGGLNTKGYDTLLERSYPPGRFIRSKRRGAERRL